MTNHFFFFFSCPSVIFCEAVAIYGVIVAIILQTKLESVPSSKMYDAESLRAGYAIFASGIIVGFANLVCGYASSFSTVMVFGFYRQVCNQGHVVLPQVMCRNHWKQLRIIWCSKLNTLCEDSCDWDLRKRSWFVWSYRGDHYVRTSNMADQIDTDLSETPERRWFLDHLHCYMDTLMSRRKTSVRTENLFCIPDFFCFLYFLKTLE